MVTQPICVMGKVENKRLKLFQSDLRTLKGMFTSTKSAVRSQFVSHIHFVQPELAGHEVLHLLQFFDVILFWTCQQPTIYSPGVYEPC
jgi:hypothetical protein